MPAERKPKVIQTCGYTPDTQGVYPRAAGVRVREPVPHDRVGLGSGTTPWHRNKLPGGLGQEVLDHVVATPVADRDGTALKRLAPADVTDECEEDYLSLPHVVMGK